MRQKIDFKKRDFLNPPGGLLVWLFIVVELICFGVALIFFAIYKKDNYSEYVEGLSSLDRRLGFFYTILLLTSGSLVASFVKSYDNISSENLKSSKLKLLTAVFLGIIFLLLKLYDFYKKIGADNVLGKNSFWDFFWLLTGFHFLHVVIGVIFLLIVLVSIGRWKFEDDDFSIRGSAAFWHMCDLIWLLLVPFLYFNRAS